MNRVEQRKVSNQKLVAEANTAKSNGGSQYGLAGCAVDPATGKSTKETQDGVLYIVGEVTAGGKINLFEALTEQIARVGVTNFDGNQLNSGSNAVLDAVSISVAINDAGVDPKNLAFDDTAEAALQNAEFRFEVDGKEIIKMPVFEAHNPNTTRTNDEKYRGLGHLPIIEAQKTCQAWIEFPTGITPDTTGGKKHYVRVELRRNQTVSR